MLKKESAWIVTMETSDNAKERDLLPDKKIVSFKGYYKTHFYIDGGEKKVVGKKKRGLDYFLIF